MVEKDKLVVKEAVVEEVVMARVLMVSCLEREVQEEKVAEEETEAEVVMEAMEEQEVMLVVLAFYILLPHMAFMFKIIVDL